jgi:hypothetical protein
MTASFTTGILRCFNYHVTRDPNPSSTNVYAFYVRNEASGYLSPPDRNVLYCRASFNGGATWNGEVRVFIPPSPPQNGFAPVPPNCNGDANGFYRIGRVWSCVDDNGYVYVAWMDNRYGKFSGDTSKDYWHVFCSRSTTEGDTWSTPIRVSGSTSDPQGTASVGGFNATEWNGNHVPPGDFLTCDADNNRLYVAWPDSRETQNGPSYPIVVYFRRIDF